MSCSLLRRLACLSTLGILTAMLASVEVHASCLGPIGRFPIRQCEENGYFEPAPFAITYYWGEPTNVSRVFWQIGFGNALARGSGSSPDGTGMSTGGVFVGNDSGGTSFHLQGAPWFGMPHGGLCISTNWQSTNGCCDNIRDPNQPLAEDGVLNPYFDSYYGVGFGYYGQYSLDWVQDYPTAVLLKSEPYNRWFAIAAVASKSRGSNGDSSDTFFSNDFCRLPPANPAVCDTSEGEYSFADVTNGQANAFDGARNAVPWQEAPKPEAQCLSGCMSAGPWTVDFSWDLVRWFHDGSRRPSTNPMMGGNFAEGVGVVDLLTKSDPNDHWRGLVRYDLERAEIGAGNLDPNGDIDFSSLSFVTAVADIPQTPPGPDGESTGRILAPGIVVDEDTCWRVRVKLGKKPQTTNHTAANCRVGRCGDLGFEVVSGHPERIACYLASQEMNLSAGPTRAGPEFVVNTYTEEVQGSPALAASPDGNFVVVWRGAGAGGSCCGVFGRRIDWAGGGLGPNLRVDSSAFPGGSRAPAVAMNRAGSFLVVWGLGGGANGPEVVGRGFTSQGVAMNEGFQVNSFTTDQQQHPTVAAMASGGFVAAWDSRQIDGDAAGIATRMFDGSGVPTSGLDIVANAVTAYNQVHPSVASRPSAGEFVVAWTSFEYEGYYYGYRVKARIFDSSGSPVTDELDVDSSLAVRRAMTDVAIHERSGDFVVVWSGSGTGGATRILGRGFDNTGQPLGDQFSVSVSSDGSWHDYPAVAMDRSGDFVVVWQGERLGTFQGDYEILGRRFDRASDPVDPLPFRVNEFRTGDQRFPDVAMDADGDFLVVWSDHEGQDGHRAGIIGRRFLSLRAVRIVEPVEGADLDCRTPSDASTRPRVTWRRGAFDRFRVHLSWAPSFDADHRISSGRALLTGRSWKPGAKKWRQACDGAGGGPLYIRVLGIDRDVGRNSPVRRSISNVVEVNTLN